MFFLIRAGTKKNVVLINAFFWLGGFFGGGLLLSAAGQSFGTHDPKPLLQALKTQALKPQTLPKSEPPLSLNPKPEPTALLHYYCTTTVLLLYCYCTTLQYQASDLVDCGRECRLEGQVFKMNGFSSC